MVLFGQINLTIPQMQKDTMKEQEKKSGNRLMEKLMDLFVHQAQEELFQV